MTSTESSGPDPVVHIVDDDEDLRQSLVFLFESVGIQALSYPDATSFLDEFDADEPAVVIVDIRMPEISGFQLQERLLAADYPAPVIFCSAHGDIPMSVRALKQGAVDFLEKPYQTQRMLEVVQKHLHEAKERFAEHAGRRDITQRIDTLTQREREVLRLVIEGLSSQLIAKQLGMSVKTVDVHRARIKSKTESETLGALVRDILLHRVSV
ncbi:MULTISPECIES: response regulator transcription factor [Prauserella salsuginis group]|uniref:RNA polymerase sigma factor (Sigma-70 family) n=2 Tax=Prauserella salsuginis group TaxID=2893672 RepID=A0A839XTF7_9PSEU|nr:MULTISPECIES: response regulator [Prauserella salsuginis group]MBB3664704.1 RNA polymerase sigma factor (sigma-70 family) [Prauserella sediminis]MCR3722170.1 two component transcriptional regulator, LuxR family [Prauserella flava]MCR3736168.1 two component transcriptional regulator, LuxR family [Prauserella salsuginis]